jgi:hypothetical protein
VRCGWLFSTLARNSGSSFATAIELFCGNTAQHNGVANVNLCTAHAHTSATSNICCKTYVKHKWRSFLNYQTDISIQFHKVYFTNCLETFLNTFFYWLRVWYAAARRVWYQMAMVACRTSVSTLLKHPQQIFKPKWYPSSSDYLLFLLPSPGRKPFQEKKQPTRVPSDEYRIPIPIPIAKFSNCNHLQESENAMRSAAGGSHWCSLRVPLNSAV